MLSPLGICWEDSFPFFEHVFISFSVTSRFPASARWTLVLQLFWVIHNPSYIFLNLTQVKLIDSESQSLVRFVVWSVVGSKSWVSRCFTHISPRMRSHNKCHSANPHMLKVWYPAWHWVGAGKPVISWIVGLQVTGTMILKETLRFQSQTFLLFLFPGL